MKAKPVSLPFALLLLFGHAYAAMPDIPPSLLKEAQQGDASAQNKIGDSYFEEEEYQQALIWYQKAAEQGFITAQINLAYMYNDGDGVPKNDQQAVVWYRKAAEQGNAMAQFNLAVKYDEGKGVPLDNNKPLFGIKKPPSKVMPLHNLILHSNMMRAKEYL